MSQHHHERPAKPFDNSLQQLQPKPFYYPQFSPPAVMVVLFVVALVFIPLGGAIVVDSESVFEKTLRYDNIKKCTHASNEGAVSFSFNGTTQTTGCKVRVSFTLDKTLSSPSYIYYGLTNFYQSYRQYSESRSEPQLAGSEITFGSASTCKPVRGPSDHNSPARETINGNDVGEVVYSPCGMVAYSMFNDSFALYKWEGSGAIPATSVVGSSLVCDGTLFTASGVPLSNQSCEKKGIALTADSKSRFDGKIHSSSWTASGDNSSANPFLAGGYYSQEPGHKLPVIEDEDFMVWARSSPLSSFRKLYRKVTTELSKGEYFFDVIEQFDVSSFNGEKKVILTKLGWVGGKNYVLGSFYLALGAISFLLGVGSLAMFLAR